MLMSKEEVVMNWTEIMNKFRVYEGTNEGKS